MTLFQLALSGCFPDVTWHDGMWWAAWGTLDGSLILRWDLARGRDTDSWIVATGPNTRLAFPRLCGPWLAFRADDGLAHLYHLDTGNDRVLGPCAGNNPVAVSERYVAWQDTGWQVWVQDLADGTTWPAAPGAPTGISRVPDVLGLELIDAVHFGHRRPNGRLDWGVELNPRPVAATAPAWADDVVVVSEHPDGGVILQRDDLRELLIWPGQDTMTPRVALAPDGTLAVVTWGKKGIRLALVSPDEGVPWQAPLPVPVPPPIPVPPPPPDPPPKEPDPMPLVPVPDRAEMRGIFDRLEAFYAGPMQRPAVPRHLDHEGAVAWPHEYYLHRVRGVAPRRAEWEMYEEIRRVLGETGHPVPENPLGPR